MSYHSTVVSCPGSTGDFTISSLPFTPVGVHITIGNKSTGHSTTESRLSSGSADGTNQWVTAILVNSNGNFSRVYSNACVMALSTPGGTITEVVKGTFVSFPTNACKFNFTATNSDYPMLLEFWD